GEQSLQQHDSVDFCLMERMTVTKEACQGAHAMSVNLLLFLFLPVCHGCHTGSFTDCQKAPFVPGHNLAGEGFDIVKMQTYGAFVVDVWKFMVEGHDGNCTLCINTLMNNQVQKLPLSGVTISAKTKYCKSQSKKLKTGQSFGATFSDRVTEVQGGNVEVAYILFNPNKKSGYKTWLKKVPAVVSYQLSSLHFLARDNPILKANLRNAIRDYIQKYTVSTSCPSACKTGRRNKDCVCKCTGHRNVDSNCCPGKPGVARMNVTTDSYVKVFYGNQGDSTPVIWNNDFPYWKYRIQYRTVWDSDNRWNDDLLGKGSITLQRGMNVNHRFNLKHSTLYVSLSVVCGPSLKGAFCDQYAPLPGSQGRLSYVHDWDRETETLPTLFQGSQASPKEDSGTQEAGGGGDTVSYNSEGRCSACGSKRL
ncbi:unnamed protein product, partial [Coregonus sp. 'balchen']